MSTTDVPKPSESRKRKAHHQSPLASKRQKLLQSRQKLPIFSRAKDVRLSLEHHSVLVLSGETGSGKSTQVPQFLLESPWCTGMIAVTQPRRVAAISLAKRVADEMGSTLGSASPASKVGYSVRFDDNTSPSTRIKYLTEGMLLQELLRDPKLSQYSCVVVDEVHERSVNVDLLLGFLKGLIYGRRKNALRVVVMSATADVEGIAKFFSTPPAATEESLLAATATDAATIVGKVDKCHVEGRQFPVRISYLSEPNNDVIDAALQRIFLIHCKEPLPGDVLVFMTGQETIQSLQKLVEDLAEKLPRDVPRVQVLPLYAALPQEAQQRIFERAPKFTRKIILSTNIAETSVTVPGVRFVIDIGKAKIKQFRHELGLESLLSKPISKSSADQRKGRAGREAAGHCFRLYTESSYDAMVTENKPEIQRCDLSTALLSIKARDFDASGGIDDILGFPFLTPPSEEALDRSLLQLLRLDAIDKSGKISAIGRQMARLPLPPALGRVLVAAASSSRECLLNAIDVVSCLSVESIFLPADTETAREQAQEARAGLLQRTGDHLTLLAALQGFAAETADRKQWARQHMLSHRALKSALAVQKQLRAQCTQLKMLGKGDGDTSETVRTLDETAQESLLKCVLRGCRDNIARLCPDKAYRTFFGNHVVAIHPASVLFGRKIEAFVYNEFVYTSKTYARGVSTIQLRWLDDLLEGDAAETQ